MNDMELVLVGVIVFYAVFFFIYPSWRRWEIERERVRHPERTPAAGVVGAIDEVFHPNAYQAKLIWEAQQELPVPAPDADGTRPDLDSGRVRIDLGTRAR